MVDALVTVAAGILKKAFSIAANEVSSALRYKEKLTELHDTLDVIRAKLSDAEGKKGAEAVMVWLKQLKSVVDEADDVLDEVNYEILRREVKKRYRSSNLKKFSSARDMGHKIEKINKELSQIYERANKLRLQDEQFEPAGNSYRLGTVPHLDEFEIIGRENDKLRLVGLLTNLRGEKLTIVPIVGMGAIGKTTLAKSIYNDPKIKQHFDVRAWLCVSVKVEVGTLLAGIYESLAGEKVKSLMRVDLIRNLREKLGSQRYLLVLDDVWDDELAYWDEFRNCMLQLDSEIGSSIIVTTRKIIIGRNATIEKSYVLESLSDDECWSIFKERALPLPDFEDIGRDIVKKCCGLPLLVDELGSMLRHYNTDKGKWLSIKGSEVWDADERGRVLSNLKLSFDNLPNSMVKQCLLYCSIFEKDEVIGREELVQLWMALGLVHTDTKTNKEMEDVGNDIFQVLVNNSLFQNVKKSEYGDIYGCQMHDLIHDLLLSLSRHEISRLVVSDDVQIPAVKHLALQRRGYENSVFDIFKEDMKKTIRLQTFFLRGDATNISLKYFKCLRILKLRVLSLDEVPESVGELVHLRYLDLSYTRIRTLPKSIGKLYHLQTLKLLDCLYTIEFPQEMRNLISLRHLVYDSHVQAPNDVGLLTSLRTLPSFQVGQQKGRQIEELGHLKHLGGKLCICNLEEIDSKEEALKADLHGKQNLYKIEFHWSSCDEGGNRNDKDVLEGLQPAANVKSLEIQNYSGNNFPEWAMKMKIETERNWTPLVKLVKIKLTDCHNCLNIPMLEDLPLLQDLSLCYLDKVTCLSSSSDQRKPLSPSLRSLKLYGMKNLEKWTHAAVNSSTMLSPLLEKLTIKYCPKIILLDESLQHPLKHLKIRECENLESVRSIQGLTSLQTLDIRFCGNLSEISDVHRNDKDVLEGLQPAANVKSLEIQNYSSNSFPEWAMKMKIETERNWTPLVKLVKIKLADCHNCLNIPMLEDLPLLQDLSLCYLDKVTCLSSSSDQRKPLSPSLRSLKLYGMKNLEKWTHAAVNSSTMLSPLLEKLTIKYCPKIILLDESLQHPLKHLKIRECENLESVRSIQGLTSLQTLDIRFCGNLSEISDVHRNDKDVLEGLQPAANVKSLEIQNYSSNSFPEWAMKMKIETERNWTPLVKLVKIKLADCHNCLNIPMLEDLPLLQDLSLCYLDKVTCLSSSSDQRKPLSPSLRSLKLYGMKNLEKWTHAAVNSSTMLSPLLEKLTIKYCPKIILLDESLQHPLKHLKIWECENLESVRSIQGLTSLQTLDIRFCGSLLEISDVHNQRCSLKDLTVRHCNKLTCLPGGLDSLALLNKLEIGQFSKEHWEHWESIPEEIKHLTTLRILSIWGFGVRELPMWLTNMSSIQEISFWNCKELNEESVLQGAPMEATRFI